jgi:hypothetical protein
MRRVKKPKYRIDKSKVGPPKKESQSARDIYEEMLRDKVRKAKRR